MADFSIDPATRPGTVHLAVPDLENALSFYEGVLGLRSLHRAAGTVLLGAGETAIVALREKPGATPKPRSTSGLYHFAILVPSRRELAKTLRRLVETQYPIGGASDHLVSEALYLDDPAGNGIEIYADRPRDRWPRDNGGIRMATDPLDVEGLVGELRPGDESWTGLAEGTTLGHVHLHVADLPSAVEFYHGVLGLDLITRFGSQAAFLSAGGYHHHLGLNTWAGVGAPPPPPGSAGLEYFTLSLPDERARDLEAERMRSSGVGFEERDDGMLVRDPSQNAVLLTVAGARVAAR